MLPFRAIYFKSVQKGSLINFQYLYYRQDPTPLVLVTSVYSDGRIAGVNLHYLTYRYIKNLTKSFCNDRTFSYQKIKGNTFLYNSFRTYKKSGVKSIKLLDCEILNKAMEVSRSTNFTESELRAIQNDIKAQVKAYQNPSANQLSNPFGSIESPF